MHVCHKKSLYFSDPHCTIEERNGFLKYICRDGNTQNYKCTYTDEYYTITDHSTETLCSNDPKFYQACGIESGADITNDEILCELYFCDNSYMGVFTSLQLSQLENMCDIVCDNTRFNKIGCGEEKVALFSGQMVYPGEICNDVCDVRGCEDEAICNGYVYGIYCKKEGKVIYLPPSSICNNNTWCDNGEDEANCTVSENTPLSCVQVQSKELVPVHNYTRCVSLITEGFSFTVSYCIPEEVALFQINCSDPSRVGLTCKINGYTSTVSKYLICYHDNIGACDDRIDMECFQTKTCNVHKHLMCDNKKDCDDGADESHQVCRTTIKLTCLRRFEKRGELPIPVSWINDGVRDCENGVDEAADWPTCGQGRTKRFVSSDEVECKNVFICREGNPGYVELEDLCDGLDTCGNENAVCSVSSRSHSVSTTVSTTNKGLVKTLSFCLRGLGSMERFRSNCTNKQFIYPHEGIFGGIKTSVILPENSESCDYMYGEQYLYTSCTGRCISAVCPLRTIPRYEACPNQFTDRVGTIVNNEYLIFLTKSFGSIYTNSYFVCDDKIKCIEYSKVCDLVYDCSDGSDEFKCTNHFRCSSSGQLLPKTKKCDGRIDCSDLSDECNEQCSKEILEGTFLKGLSWLIGFLATAANAVIIGKSLKTMRRCKTSVAVINRCLIIVIAFGDFLIGCYLFIIATFDTIIFKREYCTSQIDWTAGVGCSSIGVFSTIGSEISLFSMTGLSIIRMYGIWNSMSIPGEVNSKSILKISAAILFLLSASTVIALVPIVGTLDDFFVNGVRFSDELRIFIGTPDKTTVLDVIRAYYGRNKELTLSWKMLIHMITKMFSHDFQYKDLTEKVDKVHFYGNDGVCLFKYFVQENDPQRLFVWSILVLNFMCFLVISLSYLVIGILSRKSSAALRGSQKKQIAKRNRRMNQRIAIIISTDFLCWVPFIIICILHSLEIIDATPWYGIFSTIILPINSVINPFLYDGTIADVVKALWRSFKTRGTLQNRLLSLSTQVSVHSVTTRVTNSSLQRNERLGQNTARTDASQLARAETQI